MRPHPLTIAILAVLGLTGAAAQDVPWTVFVEEAELLASPEVSAPEVGVLHMGDAVSGELFVDPESDAEWLVVQRDGAAAYVSLNALHRVHPANVRDGDLPIGEEVVNRWWGLPLDYEPSDLVPIPGEFCLREGRLYQLRREACEALVQMLRAARRDGVDIQVVSAHRSSDYQERRLRETVARRGPGQRVVARPGHSEHQLGTTVDLSDPKGEHATRPSFATTPQGRWLAEHAREFGFVQSYTEANTEETGYDPEAWHFRYMGRSGTQVGSD